MDQLAALIEAEYFGNTLWSWGIALGIAVLAALVLKLARRILHDRLAALAPRTATTADDVAVELLKRTMGWFLIVLSLYFGLLTLELSPKVVGIAAAIAAIAFLVQVGLWAGTAIVFYLDRYRTRRLEVDASSLATLNIIKFIALTLVWALVLLAALDNLGFDVTALIAGLGIGGIAVALAAQNVLGDLFASLSIALDKPFAVKDFLIVDDYLGTVENIGIKTTRLRSLSGEQVVFSNTDLLTSRIRNYGRMFERRIAFLIGVTYETPRDKLELIPRVLKEAVEGHGDKVRFDRAHFKSYGPYSLDFETVYYVRSPDYTLYMDIQQAINLRIHEIFEHNGIEFAYPTQTLYLAQGAGGAESQ